MEFYAGIYDVPRLVFTQRREYVLDMAGLRGREKELTRNLSVGWRQRLSLGVATIHEPELLFLDEPTSGVDPVGRRRFWDLLYDLSSRGVTLFVTTHYMDEASNCTRLAFMYNGHIVADGTPSAIRRGEGLLGSDPPCVAPGSNLEDVFVTLVTAERERHERERAAR